MFSVVAFWRSASSKAPKRGTLAGLLGSFRLRSLGESLAEAHRGSGRMLWQGFFGLARLLSLFPWSHSWFPRMSPLQLFHVTVLWKFSSSSFFSGKEKSSSAGESSGALNRTRGDQSSERSLSLGNSPPPNSRNGLNWINDIQRTCVDRPKQSVKTLHLCPGIASVRALSIQVHKNVHMGAVFRKPSLKRESRPQAFPTGTRAPAGVRDWWSPFAKD